MRSTVNRHLHSCAGNGVLEGRSETPNYACKLCIWERKLYSENLRGPESWFHDQEDLLSHIHAEHSKASGSVSKDKPSWPGILDDAQACAEGYLVCDHAFEPKPVFRFTCYRCNTTSIHMEDLKNLYCLSCGHRYDNYYTSGPWRE